jgi:low affinity Fe/Cu permease
MKKTKASVMNELFEKFASRMTMLTGRPQAFLIALGVIFVWGITGPIFKFSDTWQLVINTGTTIITFLMVFLIQQAQNKDSLSIQLKLNEIVAAMEGASNRLINVEDITQEELMVLHKYYHKLSVMAGKDESLIKSHSIEEAALKHEMKERTKKAPMINNKAV